MNAITIKHSSRLVVLRRIPTFLLVTEKERRCANQVTVLIVRHTMTRRAMVNNLLTTTVLIMSLRGT